MKAHITFGSGYQLVNLLLLIIQALIMPRYLGLEVYGLGLLIVVPVLLIGGFWEPIVQYYSNEHGGVPREWWFSGSLIALVSYGLYLFAVLSFVGVNVGVVFLGLFFVLEYIFVIYVIAVYQSQMKYAELLTLSLIGLFLSTLTFLFSSEAWLVCLFYCLYFFPLFVSGAIHFKKKGLAGAQVAGAFGNILNAISTRLFYVLINNFYVIVAGFVYGPAKAALLKIVISLSSAFRFVSPLNIGHFYSLASGVGLKKRLVISLFPLLCFIAAVLAVVVLIPVLESYSRLLLAGNYEEIIEAFLLLSWGVPFYLWSPYLTIVFFKSLGWKVIFLACLVAVSLGALVMFFYGAPAFFISSSVAYCLLVMSFGAILENKRLKYI